MKNTITIAIDVDAMTASVLAENAWRVATGSDETSLGLLSRDNSKLVANKIGHAYVRTLSLLGGYVEEATSASDVAPQGLVMVELRVPNELSAEMQQIMKDAMEKSLIYEVLAMLYPMEHSYGKRATTARRQLLASLAL